MEVGASNVAMMNLTGEANCVRYLERPLRYGFRVIGNASGQATVVVPARGRTTVKLFPLSHSPQILRPVVTLAFQVLKDNIGNICTPKEDV